MNRKNKAVELLTDLTKRPSREEIEGLDAEEVYAAGKELGFPIRKRRIKEIMITQEAVLPYFEKAVMWLLKREEANKPDDFPFFRDGELFYDALIGLAQAKEGNLEERVKPMKISLGTKGQSREIRSKYLETLGITKERVIDQGMGHKKDKNRPIVFLDSGFAGSLFLRVARWGDFEEHIPNSMIKGYLMNSTSALFDEIDLDEMLSAEESKMIKKIFKRTYFTKKSDPEDGNNYLLCSYMQLTPKFTGRFVEIFNEGDIWDVLPEKHNYASKIKAKHLIKQGMQSNEGQVNDLRKLPTWVNEDVVDPVAALILQINNIRYFSDPRVHERIYDYLSK